MLYYHFVSKVDYQQHLSYYLYKEKNNTSLTTSKTITKITKTLALTTSVTTTTTTRSKGLEYIILDSSQLQQNLPKNFNQMSFGENVKLRIQISLNHKQEIKYV